MRGLTRADAEEPAEFQTLGGLVMELKGGVPKTGDSFAWAGWRFEVIDVDDRRVDRVLVTQTAASTRALAEVAAE